MLCLVWLSSVASDGADDSVETEEAVADRMARRQSSSSLCCWISKSGFACERRAKQGMGGRWTRREGMMRGAGTGAAVRARSKAIKGEVAAAID